MERATVRVYEERAEAWRDARPPTRAEAARGFGATVIKDAVVVDLGCGPGSYLPFLPRPAVALDAADAMLQLVRDVAPDAWPVRGDLEALPFRRGALGGGWARASYLHVRHERLPAALAELHHALAVAAPVNVSVLAGEVSGELPDDDFPGRWFAGWSTDAFHDVVIGAGFDVGALDHADGWVTVEATRARTLPDTVGPGMRILVCGLNPSVYAADAGVGFARPGNRFWPAALAAGLVTIDRDARAALAAGVGMTDLVKRATPSAAELTRGEYRAGLARVERLARWLQPGAVCFVGLAGWRAAVDRHAFAGVQRDGFAGRPAYVMPSTSGLNARTSVTELAEHLRAAAALADRFGATDAPKRHDLRRDG